MLTREQAVWKDWLYIDENENVQIREDAPEKVKKAYEKYRRSGIK